ncbi:hypothetical protein AVEN_77041-1 [Araneus ventricosus]|uniref:PiggyBac transposable element-derived protein domain-containing protein n=1 Tax=Araneus ventricosus TaxID=182803 RepID=A0A4Y2NE37_ARAVE|nr:hypothetical protein AVEN_6926-1 [Araneus ventricosus]GBN36909.1 hypothetical protein AVEN_196781-1 [Araneus ventricosus]GBN36938.1 hypothetical protein AVEN_32277-1 [Araneus ventricosus]GBN36959.1 hypothetical protein AVEN_77041-1 [Araneus ventricosus]
MDKDHFKEIIRFLRFDHITKRLERLMSDKFAMASALWYPFIENSASYYKTGVNLTVDEQLPPSKARFPFIQYIPCKPDKFRIKFWLLVCTNSIYVLNSFPYTGADSERPSSQTVYEHLVMNLIQPLMVEGRTVTIDRYFSTVKLCGGLKP